MSGGSPVNLYEIVAHLLKEYGLTLDQIGKLSRWEIRSLYFYPRDEHGALRLKGGDHRPLSAKQEHYQRFERFGMPRWWIDERWEKDKPTSRGRRRGRPRGKGQG